MCKPFDPKRHLQIAQNISQKDLNLLICFKTLNITGLYFACLVSINVFYVQKRNDY